MRQAVATVRSNFGGSYGGEASGLVSEVGLKYADLNSNALRVEHGSAYASSQTRLHSESGLPFKSSDKRTRSETGISYKSSVVRLHHESSSSWWGVARVKSECSLIYGGSLRTIDETGVTWKTTNRLRDEGSLLWDSSGARIVREDALLWSSLGVRIVSEGSVLWGSQVATGTIFGIDYETETEDEPEVPIPADPILSTYKIMNQLTILDSLGQPLKKTRASLSLSMADGFWSLSATAAQDPTPLIGTIITITINTETWSFYIDRITEAKKFGRTSWTFTGIGLQGLYALPHSAPESRAEASNSLASSLAQDIIGIPPASGTVNWTGTNWEIAGGVWSYDSQSKFQAINQLANAAGLVVIPDKENQDMEVRPYHETRAWDWIDGAEYAALNKADFFEFNYDRPTTIDYNGIYVPSTRTGTGAFVRRSGTDGATTLPEVSNDLLTDVSANLSRGLQDLSKAYVNLTSNGVRFLNQSELSIPVGVVLKIDSVFYHVESNQIDISTATTRIRQSLSLTSRID